MSIAAPRPTLATDGGSELDLLESAKKGSKAAFAAVVRRYQGLVCSLAYSLTGSSTASEEIAQAVFIVAWTRLPELRPKTFSAWIYGITKNVSRDVLRRQRTALSFRRRELVSGPDLPAGPSPLDSIISQEEERTLWRALAQIPEAY